MAHKHRLPILLSIAGDEHEIVINVQYTITRARPATPPSYSHGGLPPEPAEISITSGQVETTFGLEVVPDWLLDIISNSEEAQTALGDAADWGEPYRDPDDARDRRIDDDLMAAITPTKEP